mgnify:CR=1 FL=1
MNIAFLNKMLFEMLFSHPKSGPRVAKSSAERPQEWPEGDHEGPTPRHLASGDGELDAVNERLLRGRTGTAAGRRASCATTRRSRRPG